MDRYDVTPRMCVQQSEKQIETSIIYYLNLQPGCFAFKYDVKGTWDQSGGFFRKVGKGVALGGADIVGILSGAFFAFEVKTPRAYKNFFTKPGEHELRQRAFLHQVRSKGGMAEVVCSIQMVESLIAKLRAQIKKDPLPLG